MTGKYWDGIVSAHTCTHRILRRAHRGHVTRVQPSDRKRATRGRGGGHSAPTTVITRYHAVDGCRHWAGDVRVANRQSSDTGRRRRVVFTCLLGDARRCSSRRKRSSATVRRDENAEGINRYRRLRPLNLYDVSGRNDLYFLLSKKPHLWDGI